MIPKERPSTDPVEAYAWDVYHDKVVACRLVKLACERHWRDREANKFDWRPAKARKAIRFFLFLKHSKGEWAGQPLELSPWQAFCVGSVFGWHRENGTRRFRTAYQEVPRKNGKSTQLAGVGLYGLIADKEPGAEIYTAATKKDQARIIFGEAHRMVRTSPELRERVSVFKLNLSVDETASKFEPLSADEQTLDGLNPHFVLLDELHKQRNRAVLDVLDTALGARRQPLLWIITTAGDDAPDSVYAWENDHATKVLERIVEDDTHFVFVTTIDDGDRWDDPKAWAKANPNLGISVYLDDIRRQAIKAKANPPAQEAFKRLRLNVRTAAATRLIPMPLWRKNTLGRFDPAQMRGRRCWCGLDLSSKIDLSAFLKLFPPEGEEERWRVVAKFWMPADTIEEKSDRDRKSQYRRWVDEGWIEASPGNIIDHLEIQRAVIADNDEHEFLGLAYDPWNATQLAIGLQSEGIQVYEFIQGIRTYTAPTKELMAMLLGSKLDHGDNPVLTWMASNLAVKPDKNENLMPEKKLSMNRIDGMSALIMAIGLMLTEEAPPYSDGRELIILK
jgi:phage terminase large subunit-like protein